MKKIHYAWVVCAAGTLAMICNMGICSTLMSAFLPYIKATGISGSESSMIVSVRSFSSLATMFLVPLYYRRVSLRLGMTLATVLGGAGMLVFALGSSVWMYYIGAGIAGVALALGASIPAALLVNNWFTTRRGTALGIAASGSGIAASLFPTLVDLLVRQLGLRAMFLCLAGFIFLSAAVCWVLIRSTPEEKGLAPYSAGVDKVKNRPAAAPGYLPAAGWLLLVPLMLLDGTASITGNAHISVLMTTSGYTTQWAALVLSLFGLLLTAGKLLFGVVADRLGPRMATTVSFALLILGLLMPMAMDGSALWPCVVMAVLMGFGYPPCTVGVSLWAADFSTPEGYAKTLRWMQILNTCGGILTGTLPGRMYDTYGTYRGAFVLMAGGIALGTVLLWLCYRIRKTD